MPFPRSAPFPDAGPPGGTVLVAELATRDWVPEAIAAADLVDLGDADGRAVAAFRSAHPGIAFCADHEGAAVVRCEALARATGAALLCRGPEQARASSLPAGRLLVPVPPAGIPAALREGWLPLVDADLAESALPEAARGPGAAVAIMGLSCWLGAAAVRTSRVRQGRRALDMVAAIAGLRAPARTVRGLA